MPTAAPRPCRHPGCGVLVRDGGQYCPAHKRPATPRLHGSAGKRRTGRAGVRDRERIRRRDCGLCQACLEKGGVTPGTQVDHIVPLEDGGPDDDDNKRLLCDDCHAEKCADEARRRRSRRRGGGAG